MAKTFKYWVIVAGNTPTAFRSQEPEPLLPTLKQLQRTQPNVTLGWFERDRLWLSPEQAEADFERRRGLHRERGAAWRPGGQHKDPKARVELTRDQKRAKFKKQLGFKAREASDPDSPRPEKPRGLVVKPNDGKPKPTRAPFKSDRPAGSGRFGQGRSGASGPRWPRKPGGSTGRSRGSK
jgi:hypothetical protein